MDISAYENKSQHELIAEIEKLQSKVASLQARLQHGDSRSRPSKVGPIRTGLTRQIVHSLRQGQGLDAANQRVDQSLHCLQAVVESMTDALIIADPAGNLVYHNPASMALHGYRTRQEACRPAGKLGCFWEIRDLDGRLLPPADWPISRAVRGQRYTQVHVCVRRTDTDKEFIGSYNGTPVCDRDGRMILAIVTIRDITHIKRSQQALRASEAKYRTLAESIHDIVYSTDARGYLNYVSPQVARYGLAPEEMLDRSFLEFVVPEDRQRLLSEFGRRLETGSESPMEFRYLDKHGRVYWCEERGKTLYDQAGCIIGMFGVLRDITERKQSEEALRQSEERLRLAAHAAGFGTFDADLLSGTGYWSPELYTIVGISFDAIPSVGDAPGCTHPDDIEAVRLAMRRAVDPAGDGTMFHEHRIIRPDGAVRWLQMRAQVQFAGQGTDRRPVRVNGMVFDITERKQAEAAAQLYGQRVRYLAMKLSLAEEQERRRLAAVLHDELVQVLVAARIRSALMQRARGEPARRRQMQEIDAMLARATQVARSLMSQLSHRALYDMGFVPAARWLAKDIQELYGLEVSLQDDDLPKPIAEPIRVLLYQCLREALVNAAKHAGTSQAHVSLCRHGATVRVVVEDKGVGFDPSAINPRPDSSGFGLFSIKERLEPLGGKVDINSAPGQGTTVVLEVPADPNPTTPCS